MYNFDSLRIFTNLYGVRPSVCYPGYIVYTIYGGVILESVYILGHSNWYSGFWSTTRSEIPVNISPIDIATTHAHILFNAHCTCQYIHVYVFDCMLVGIIVVNGMVKQF